MSAPGAPRRADDPVPAGRVGPWLDRTRRAIAGEVDAEVPCGSCTACCEAAQFVLIGPEEVDALAHVPKALRFPAPGLPAGHVVMGYDEHGRCPMFVDGGCSIYEHRPRACRTYDCRVFTATGVDPAEGDGTKVAIRARVARWRFDVADASDRRALEALRRATAALDDHADELGERLPPTATGRAVLAVRLVDRLGDGDPTAADLTAAIDALRPS